AAREAPELRHDAVGAPVRDARDHQVIDAHDRRDARHERPFARERAPHVAHADLVAAIADGYRSECRAPGSAGCSEWRLPGSGRGWPVTRSAWRRCARSSRPAPVTACKQGDLVPWAVAWAPR